MISLSNRERRRQLNFLGLTNDDLQIVKAHRAELTEAARRVMKRFPEYIASHPETRSIMEQYSIERHRRAVGNHMLSLADGVINDAYVDKRITVGQVHDEVELAPHFYMSAFQLLFTAFVDELISRYKHSGEQMGEVLKAFGKLFNFDMQLILEAYFQSYEKTIKHLAYYDDLTGYPNWTLFKDRVNSALRRAERSGGKTAVLFIDLDRFSMINDSLGRNVGDELLKETAERLVQTIREGDTFARIGGDEFAILLADMQSDNEPARIAEQITRTMERPFQVGDGSLTLSPSVGIAIFPDDGADAASLLARAEVAMDEATKAGIGFRFYTTNMHEEVAQRLGLENALRKALERDEFVLHYQPLFALPSRRLIGFEALLRWRRAGETWIGPNDFIPLAEETGLIVPIGDWVLSNALSQLKTWQKTGFDELKISVNLSPVQLQDEGLTNKVAELLSATGVEPNCLQLEITENVMLGNAEKVLQTLAQLQATGVSIVIDDFGTGYSSLRYLHDLPISGLKIDRSFVSALATDKKSMGITEMMIGLAKNLQLDITAEGVETDTQLQQLQERGCDHVQGFLLGKPVPAMDAEALLSR